MPLVGVGNTGQVQNSVGVYTGAVTYYYNAESYHSTVIPLVWQFATTPVVSFSGEASCVFDAIGEQRGGRGAYSKRKISPKPTIFIVEPILTTVNITGVADVEFDKRQKFEFLSSINNLSSYVSPQLEENDETLKPQEHVEVQIPVTYEYEAELFTNVTRYRLSARCDYERAFNNRDDDFILTLLLDDYDHEEYVCVIM